MKLSLHSAFIPTRGRFIGGRFGTSPKKSYADARHSFRDERIRRISASQAEYSFRKNPMSDKLGARNFHHIEFYCGDATNTFKRFMHGLGMTLLAKSDQSTGNTEHSSYVLQSGEVRMVFTAALPKLSSHGLGYKRRDGGCNVEIPTYEAGPPFPNFEREVAQSFFSQHGTAVRAVAIEVDDAAHAWEDVHEV